MKTAVKGESKLCGLSADMVIFTRPKGLKGPTVKHLSVLAKRHMITVGVRQSNLVWIAFRKQPWMEEPLSSQLLWQPGRAFLQRRVLCQAGLS